MVGQALLYSNQTKNSIEILNCYSKNIEFKRFEMRKTRNTNRIWSESETNAQWVRNIFRAFEFLHIFYHTTHSYQMDCIALEYFFFFSAYFYKTNKIYMTIWKMCLVFFYIFNLIGIHVHSNAVRANTHTKCYDERRKDKSRAYNKADFNCCSFQLHHNCNYQCR